MKNVRSIKDGSKPKPAKMESVACKHRVGLKITRSFIILSEKEMRRDSGLSRIPKMPLKNLPALTVPSETGVGEETVYAFQDSANPHRRAELCVEMDVDLHRDVLPPETFTWLGQGDAYWKQELKDQAQDSGIAALISKEVYLPEWSKFMEERLVQGGDSESEEAPAEDAVQQDGFQENFSGVAASELSSEATLPTPRPSRKAVVNVDSSVESKGLKRGSSTRSLAGSGGPEPENESASVGETAFAEAEELEGSHAPTNFPKSRLFLGIAVS